MLTMYIFQLPKAKREQVYELVRAYVYENGLDPVEIDVAMASRLCDLSDMIDIHRVIL